jgi:hypothetical protein
MMSAGLVATLEISSAGPAISFQYRRSRTALQRQASGWGVFSLPRTQPRRWGRIVARHVASGVANGATAAFFRSRFPTRGDGRCWIVANQLAIGVANGATAAFSRHSSALDRIRDLAAAWGQAGRVGVGGEGGESFEGPQ